MALNLKTPIKQVAEEAKAAIDQTVAAIEKKQQEVKSPTNMAAVLAAIKKDKGDKVIVPGNAIPAVKRLPTGIFEFDFYTGGGFPRGRYSIIYGPESSNKTNIALKAVASAQKDPAPCNKAAWVNIEQSFDAAWAEKLGVDTSQLMVVNAGYGEEAIDLVDALVRADDLDVLVVDSMAGLIASKEIAQSVEKFDVGSSALLIKRMVNKLMIAFCEEARKDHYPTVILINQTRFKPGVLFGDPETMPGGEAQKFLSSLRIRFYAKNVIDKPTQQLLFKDTNAVIKKAKVPVRAMSFKFNLCVHETDGLKIGDTDSFNTVKGHLQALNLLHKLPKGYTIQGISEKCPVCKKGGMASKKPCSGCGDTGEILKLYTTLTSIQDQYEQDWAFKVKLQQMVIDAYGSDSMFLVDESNNSPKEVEPGEAVPAQSIAEE